MSEREERVWAVSYTHLDVYKRQVVGFQQLHGLRTDAVVLLAQLPVVAVQKVLRQQLNVDVYKRQARGCSSSARQCSIC